MDVKEEKVFQPCVNVPVATGRWAHGNQPPQVLNEEEAQASPG